MLVWKKMVQQMTTKEKILEILSNNIEHSVSGEILAQECGVSRAAIWKAINTLREQGCSIEGTTNGGYIMRGAPDIFTTEAFIQELTKNFPDLAENHIECFKEIDSTNTYAKRLLSENGNLRFADGSLTPVGKKYHKSIYVAESQTAGRGRLGRTFYSPSKTGIYLSIIYAPKGGIKEPAKLTAFSAVALERAIFELYGIQAKIKWINDIFINGKKVAGILTEGFTNFETGQIESAIVGIGINISENPDFFPDDVKKIAGSIMQNTEGTDPSSVSRIQLAALVAGKVLEIFEEDSKSVMAEYKEHSFLIGQKITVHPVIGDENSNYSATVLDIDESASLIVKTEQGEQRTLSSGEVTLHSVHSCQ